MLLRFRVKERTGKGAVHVQYVSAQTREEAKLIYLRCYKVFSRSRLTISVLH